MYVFVVAGSNGVALKSLPLQFSTQQLPLSPPFLFTTQTEKALQVALEASQSESAALKLAYQYSSEKYAELKGTYEDLLEQLKEEVSSVMCCVLCALCVCV